MTTRRGLSVLMVAGVLLGAVTACSGETRRNSNTGGDGVPCRLFAPSMAAKLLGGDAKRISFEKLVQANDGPLKVDAGPGVEAGARRTCSYAIDKERFAGVQVDRGLFRSVDEFRVAAPDGEEVLKSPGLAATYERSEATEQTIGTVLVNNDGDSITLVVRGAKVSRSDFIAVLSDLAKALPRAS